MSYREEWKEYRLDDLVKINYGKDHKKLDNGSIPVYGSGGIMRKVNKFLYDTESILIPRKGTLGNLFYVNKKFWTVDTLFWTHQIHKELNMKFLFFQLKTLDLASLNVGSAVPSLTTKVLNKLKIELPPLPTQNRIASILSAFDEKIEVNRQMNATLEAMAQAMFREMCLPDDEEELGEGWEWKKIGDLVDTVSNTYKFKDIEEIIFLNTGDVSKGFVQHHDYRPTEGLPGQAKKRIKKGDILYSEIRPKNKRYAYVDFDAEDYVVSTKLMVLRSKEIIDTMYIYFYITRDDVIAKLQQLAESRSGTFPQITFKQLKNVDIPIPTKEILNKFLVFLKPAYEKIYQNHQENLELAKSRDLLLPKLMSGEIEV